jgi:hypothetical protein
MREVISLGASSKIIFFPARQVSKESYFPGQKCLKRHTVCEGEASTGVRRRMEGTEKAIEVYQLRIWIRKISPQIWRRLLVRSDSTIAQLHDTLQIAFGWADEHLHQFLIRGKPYGVWKPGGLSFDDNPHQEGFRRYA